MKTKVLSNVAMPIWKIAATVIGLDARRDAERRLRAARRDQRDLVADAQAQVLGEPRADRHALPGVEAVERALGDMALDAGQALEIGLANAAHQRAGRN